MSMPMTEHEMDQLRELSRWESHDGDIALIALREIERLRAEIERLRAELAERDAMLDFLESSGVQFVKLVCGQPCGVAITRASIKAAMKEKP